MSSFVRSCLEQLVIQLASIVCGWLRSRRRRSAGSAAWEEVRIRTLRKVIQRICKRMMLIWVRDLQWREDAHPPKSGAVNQFYASSSSLMIDLISCTSSQLRLEPFSSLLVLLHAYSYHSSSVSCSLAAEARSLQPNFQSTHQTSAFIVITSDSLQPISIGSRLGWDRSGNQLELPSLQQAGGDDDGCGNGYLSKSSRLQILKNHRKCRKMNFFREEHITSTRVYQKSRGLEVWQCLNGASSKCSRISRLGSLENRPKA